MFLYVCVNTYVFTNDGVSAHAGDPLMKLYSHLQVSQQVKDWRRSESRPLLMCPYMWRYLNHFQFISGKRLQVCVSVLDREREGWQMPC